ncbi:MAG: hypothetical protein OEO23_08170 [Gemmatimonadota bacterium]|nr:hypothetical protein [Gemmatimonadota bacterium]
MPPAKVYLRLPPGLALSFSILVLLPACASLSDIGRSDSNQMTAAITDLRESTAGRLTLSAERLAPFRLSEDGASPPEVRSAGRHGRAWLDEMVAAGAVDGICGGPDTCDASPSTTLVTLSGPFDGRTGAFVDARIETVSGPEGASVRQTRLLRLQIVRGASGWRVVAATPLWETMG